MRISLKNIKRLFSEPPLPTVNLSQKEASKIKKMQANAEVQVKKARTDAYVDREIGKIERQTERQIEHAIAKEEKLAAKELKRIEEGPWISRQAKAAKKVAIGLGAAGIGGATLAAVTNSHGANPGQAMMDGAMQAQNDFNRMMAEAPMPTLNASTVGYDGPMHNGPQMGMA